MNISNNFLSKKDFKKINNFLMDTMLPWYYENVTAKGSGKKYGQLAYTFILQGGVINTSREFLDNFNPLFKKLNYKKITRLKANLLLKNSEIKEHSMHIDQKIGTTGILYINNNNGYTKFENGKKIKSKENKYVEFNSSLKHTGTTCTDKDRRVVLNINYV